MGGTYKFIPEISPGQRNWEAKVVVAEKLSPKEARNSNTKYQNMVLMDFGGNTVHATLYDGNILAFEDQLLLSKTYIISNAIVKDTKSEYKALNGDFQWTITGKTRIQEVKEDNLEFLFSTYKFTRFDELEKYMDCNSDISILAVAIDMRPKRLIQTRNGTQSYVQDLILIDKNFNSITLSMWDNYVEKECILLAEKLAAKPVVLANRLKVSSFNGLTLSTKINSTFFIDAPFNKVAELRAWVDTHTEELNEFTLDKSCCAITSTKLTPPAQKKLTEIQNMKGRLLGRKYFWVRAKPMLVARTQPCWYMSCVNCNKVTHANFGDTFACIYCKYPSSRAVPRATINVQLEDSTGILNASAIGSPAEILLKSDAESLMNSSKSATIVNVEESMNCEEQIFYIKVTQLEPNAAEYKYEVVFVLDPSSTVADTPEGTSENEKDSNLACLVDNNNSNNDNVSPPAKRSLFHPSSEPMISIINPVAKYSEKKKLVSTNDPVPKHPEKKKARVIVVGYMHTTT